MRSGISLLAMAVASFGGQSLAYAQNSPPASAPTNSPHNEPQSTPAGTGLNATGLEEIVVTAQRRSQRQQDVPIAITTLSSRQLDSAGVLKTDALVQITPGLVVNREIFGGVPYIRGVGSNAASPASESPVATYIDGVYYSSVVGNVFSFNNIRQVEVLKGPQGTLFGRNATGGLISVTTRDPSSQTSVEGSLGYGDYNTIQGNFYATGGSDRLAADLAVYGTDQMRGFGKNSVTGADVNRDREIAVRGKLRWASGSADRVTLSGDWSRDRTDTGVVLGVVPGGILLDGSRYGGHPQDARANYPDAVKIDSGGASLRYEHDFGSAHFSSISAYRKLEAHLALDQDGTPFPFFNVDVTQRSHTFQQELLLVGHSHALDWTTGLFYYSETAGYSPLEVASPIIPPANFATNTRERTKSYAGFAQGTYDLGAQSNLTVGLRYTVDYRHFNGTQVGTAGSPANGITLASADAKAHFPKLTYRVALDHKLAPDMLIYASYDRGFRSGVFATGSVSDKPVRPETLDALQGGIKADLFDRVLRLNLAAFYYKYKDIQLARIVGGAGVLLNAARARSYGGEIEATFAPKLSSGNLQITANASLLNAKYTSFPDGPRYTVNPAGGDVQDSLDLAGYDMVRAPKLTLNAGIDYSHPLGAGAIELTANVYHSASYAWEPDGRLRQPAYDTLNGQIGYSFGADRRFRVRVWARNLTNTLYYAYELESVLGDLGNPAPPRTFGGAFDFKF